MKSTEASHNREMDKENVVYMHDSIFAALKKTDISFLGKKEATVYQKCNVCFLSKKEKERKFVLLADHPDSYTAPLIMIQKTI